MARYRWLDSTRPCVSMAAQKTLHGWLRGRRGWILTLPVPGTIANVLVDFEGADPIVVPAGTLRTLRTEEVS